MAVMARKRAVDVDSSNGAHRGNGVIPLSIPLLILLLDHPFGAIVGVDEPLPIGAVPGRGVNDSTDALLLLDDGALAGGGGVGLSLLPDDGIADGGVGVNRPDC
jgi:hypothetical protein